MADGFYPQILRKTRKNHVGRMRAGVNFPSVYERQVHAVRLGA